MNHNDEWKQQEKGLMLGMREGSFAFPYLLLKYYHILQISETEAMLILHLMAFKEKEHNDFPTIDEISSRMSVAADAVIKALQKLMKHGYVAIDEEMEDATGIQFERYSVQPVFEKIAEVYINEMKAAAEKLVKDVSKSDGKDIFSTFEKEFARPLSPMECETITKWLDTDRYPDELIITALKEAVFAGKVHFRYIDRILLEWSRNRILTQVQAKEFTQKFRGTR